MREVRDTDWDLEEARHRRDRANRACIREAEDIFRYLFFTHRVVQAANHEAIQATLDDIMGREGDVSQDVCATFLVEPL